MVIDIAEALTHPENLSPQVRNLVAALVMGDTYLVDGIRRGRALPRRIVNGGVEISRSGLEGAIDFHRLEPFRTHRLFIGTLANIEDSSRLPRYIDASLDLEVLLDRLAFPENKIVVTGIPEYLMDGYTDMGQSGDNDIRHGREKFRVEKAKIKDHLGKTRAQALLYLPKGKEDELLEWIAEYIITNIPYDENAVVDMAAEAGGRTIIVDELEKGVCRHHAVMAQVLLQVAGIRSYMEKGRHYLGRHVWNLLEGPPERIFDVTRKSNDTTKSAIVPVTNRGMQYYEITPNDMNHYKIVHN